MLQMKIRRILKRFRDRQKLRFPEKLACEADACRHSFLREAIRENDAGVTGKIRQKEVASPERWSNVHINTCHQFVHLLDHKIPDPVCFDVLDGRYEPRTPE